jgi:hypothetical protein
MLSEGGPSSLPEGCNECWDRWPRVIAAQFLGRMDKIYKEVVSPQNHSANWFVYGVANGHTTAKSAFVKV